MSRVISFLSLVVVLFYAGIASAELDLTNISVDTQPVFTLAGIIIAAIAGIWAIKKVIKLANRS